MFEANQFKRTEELLQSILVELRTLTSMMESLPERLREAANEATSGNTLPSEDSATHGNLPPDPAPPSNPGSEPNDPPRQNPRAFDLDAFLMDNLKTKD